MVIEPIRIIEPFRAPYNIEYCKEVNCPHLARDRWCVKAECVRTGQEKWPAYFTIHGELAGGDIPNA